MTFGCRAAPKKKASRPPAIDSCKAIRVIRDMRGQRTILRANMLLVFGIAILVLIIAIEAQRSRMWKRFALVYRKNAIACEMPLDLDRPTTQQSVFSPLINGKFTLYLYLHTPIPEGFEQQGQLIPPNEIENSLQKEDFRISWVLRNEEQNIANGAITQADLYAKSIAVDISYLFGKEDIPLKIAHKYELLVEVEEPSQTLARFDPTVIIRTGGATLKGRSLAGWKTRDTILVLTLALGLITAGFIKQRSEKST